MNHPIALLPVSVKTINIKYCNPSRGSIRHVVADATWRKLHLAIYANTHEVIAAEVSLVLVGYNEVLPTLLNPLR